MGSWRLRSAIVGAGLALAALAPAHAVAAVGAPVDLGVGERPNVTVADDGTAHIAWTGEGANSKELDYCRLPRGATACSPKTIINAPGDSLSKPLPFAIGSTISVISYRYGLTTGPFAAVMRFTSTDGGATFDTGTTIGSIAPFDFAFGPGDNVSGVTAADSCGLCFQAWPPAGGPATGPAVLSADHPYQSSIAMIDATTPIAVFATGGGDAQFRRYSGSGDVNDAANWTPAVDIGPLDYTHLVSGSSGVFLVGQDQLSGTIMQARKFDGTTFGSRVTITTGVRPDHAAEDALGRVHVVGGSFDAGPTGASLFYATSDSGTAWETQRVVFPGVPSDMRLAIAFDHFGTVVGRYATGPTGTLFASSIGPSAAVPTTTKFVDATVVSGTVLIRVPPSKKFVRLQTGDVIPVGSTVDTAKGRVRITIALPSGKLQATDFFRGIFKVTQAKAGLATMVLGGGSFKSCGARAGALAAKSRRLIRELWGNGSGQFRTKGRYATAAIRGTTWDTVDRCDGTLIKVTKGRILVTDLKTKRKITLKAGQSYLAKA